MELFKMFGSVFIKDEASKTLDSIEKKSGNTSKTLSKLGDVSKKMGIAAVAGVTAVGASVVAITKKAIDEGAELEQSIGGIETLYKKSADSMIKNANMAFKTTGQSANEYMSTVTGFSASLIQGLGGDTDKAAEISHMAMVDMSDNANKMGTAQEDIQNAYQGFAKQNYTMKLTSAI